MEPSSTPVRRLVQTTQRLAHRLLTIGDNRFELLKVEVQEERERLLHALLLALGVALFALLAGMTLTATIVVCLWDYSRLAALLVLGSLYGVTAVWLYVRLTHRLNNWRMFPATFDQLRKDRADLERQLR